MKRRLSCYFLALAMLIVSVSMALPVFAKQDFSMSADFTNYTGSWSTTSYESAAMPSVDGGSFAMENSPTEVSGVTSGTAANSKYGTSVKVYSAYSETISTTASARYTLDTANFLKHSAYFETSMYVEEPADSSMAPRSVRIHGVNDAGTSSSQVNPLLLQSNGSIYLMGEQTDASWDFDTWYDMKAWMNIDSGEYKVEVWSNGTLVTEASGVSDSVSVFGVIKTVTFLHNAVTGHQTYMKGKDPQITYFDNLKVESIYKFHINETTASTHAVMNFETIDVTSKSTINSYMSDKGNFWYGNSGNADGTTLEKVKTDRGYSLRIKPWVLSTDEYTWSYSNITKEDGTVQKLGDVYDLEGNLLYARGTMLYPQVYFDFKKANYIYDAAYFKTSFQFEDDDFGSFNIQVTNYYTPVSVQPNGSISVFGQDSGLDFAIGDWFDVEGTIDLDTGYYTISLAQEGNETKYEATGYVTPVDIHTKGAYNSIYRLRVNYWNRSKANDWSVPTSILLDDMQLGPVSKLKGPVADTYTFADADEAAKFATTGGTAAIESEALKVTGAADGTTETAVSMAMPFVNTTFKYSADVTLGDLTADRSLVVQNHVSTSGGVRTTTPVEVAKFGADGKLYIGGTEISDVTIAAGTYTADVVFNQGNYTAAVKISKDGNVVAEADAALGTAAVKIINVDWKVGAGASAVTTLDNVSYTTVYDFEIDENLSTTGEDAIVTAADDDITVTFTNAIDFSSFTEKSVLVNNGANPVTGITKVDDYTVDIDFDKVQGTHYHIDFVDVSDVFGNTLTDYIEFDTIRQDLVMSAVSFKKNGVPLSLIEAGEITVSFDAVANNGTSFDMIYLVGLYNGGVLVDSEFSTFTVGAKRNHTQSK